MEIQARNNEGRAFSKAAAARSKAEFRMTQGALRTGKSK